MSLPSAVFEGLLGKFPRNRRDDKNRRTDRDYLAKLIDITEPPYSGSRPEERVPDRHPVAGRYYLT